MGHIQVMFDPKTIALIGATEKAGAIGRTILENLLRSKERRIIPVNPHASKVLHFGELSHHCRLSRACGSSRCGNSCPVSTTGG